MPTYQYRCTDCGRDLEVVQKFSDPSLTVCPTCSGTLRKVFNAVGVVFKGSGFYRNDSRAGNGDRTSESNGDKNGEKKPAESGEKAGADTNGKPTESKPSEKPAAEAKPSSNKPESSSTGTKAAAS